ncbi:hypothetical protein ABTW96_09065 [Nocardia beijingensis]|uniref:hypothetical protein n=1 Tax=Nocardia beijingensis TaxID=95162 RepID=UPI0033181CEE
MTNHEFHPVNAPFEEDLWASIDFEFEDLLAASSLGTDGARAVRRRVPSGRVTRLARAMSTDGSTDDRRD